MKKHFIVFTVAAVSCVGCKVKQPYNVPVAPVPAVYQNAASESMASTVAQGWVTASPADAQPKNQWWEIFGDPLLNTLETRVDADNQSLKAAVSRFTEARALVRASRSQRLPVFSVGGDVLRARESMNQGVPPPASESDFNDFKVGLSAAWEPDLWGRISTMINASVQQAQANAADLENIRLSLHAELAYDYLTLCSLDNERKVLQDSVAAYTKALKMMEDRYQGGLANRADVEQARTQLEAASAQEADISNSRMLYLHAIAVLTGQLPEGLSVPEAVHIMTPPAVPTGIPSELLERRPDIAAAERRVAAANSQIGLARSAFYPQVVLSGAIGMDSKSIGTWYDAPSRYWAVGPVLAQTIFDGGHRRAVLAKAVASYDESIANYRQNVLTAFQQVEDNLASLKILSEEAARQKRAVEAARRAEELAMNRYRGGMVTYLDVISTQSTRLQNERIAVDIERRRMEASVALVRALGGGWSIHNLPQAATVETGR